MAVSNMTGPRKGSRYHRMDDIPKDAFTPRAYQIELLEGAMKQNTVLCLSCSQSKLFLSLMVAKQMASVTRFALEKGGKRTFFLTDSNEDLDMIYQTLPHHTDLPIGKFSAVEEEKDIEEEKNVATSDKSDKLSLVQNWRKVIQDYSIIVCKGSCFLSALSKGMIQPEMVNLLIFDDCHNCVDAIDHPYTNIVSYLVDWDGEEGSKPHILGVTASIVGTECTDPKYLQHTIQSMEKSLNSHAETSMLILSERFGSRPTESVVMCHALTEKQSLLIDELEDILLDHLEFIQDCNITIDDSVDNRNPLDTPQTVITECLNILSVLGSWCTSSVAEVFIMQIDKIIKCEKNDVHKKFLRSVNTTLRILVKTFDNNFAPDYDIDQLLDYTTSKVKELVTVLRNYRPEIDFMIINNDISSFDNDGDFSDLSDDEDEFLMPSSDGEDDNYKSSNRPLHVAIKRTPDGGVKRLTHYSDVDEKNLCGIVFVENHYIAFGLNKILEEICSWDENLCFVKNCHIIGHSLKGGTSKIKRNKSYKKQEETLRKFRMQEKNLVITTHELEEGIDLPKCNLVVRFDPPKDYRSYTLSKGRARARDASFVILLDEDNNTHFHSNLEVFKGIEQVLLGNHKTEDHPVVDERIDEIEFDHSIPNYSSNYAEISMEGAIALINRYCAKLPSDAFTHLTPQCHVETLPGDPPAFIAYLRLPINSPIKQELTGPAMRSAKLAEKAVALKMCEILHKKGELDDYLVPVGKEMFLYEEEEDWADEEDAAGQARPGTTKRKQYYVKKVANALVKSQVTPSHACYVYLLDLRLTGKITEEQNTRGRVIYAPEDTSQTLGLLLSKEVPQMPSFPIYTRSGEVTASIQLLKKDALFTDEELAQLEEFHHFVFSGVLNLEKEPMEFLMDKAQFGCMVVPLNGKADLNIDWSFVQKVIKSAKIEKRKTPGKQAPKDPFTFCVEKFDDAVVMPSYRNIDQPQHFYVAEIRHDLNPRSPFPSPDLYKTFQDYYSTKYGLAITNTTQPLLDVDHTSVRLNLLTPRYMNQKGVALPTSSAETKKARRENLQQKQILIPELCDVHEFPASLWRKTVCLPALLYRLNCLLLSEELRIKISRETGIGIENLPDGFQFPQLDFGFETSPEKLRDAETKVDASSAQSEDSDTTEKIDAAIKGDKCIESKKTKNVEHVRNDDLNDSSMNPAVTPIKVCPDSTENKTATVIKDVEENTSLEKDDIHSSSSTDNRSESLHTSNGICNGHANNAALNSSPVSHHHNGVQTYDGHLPNYADGQQRTNSSSPGSVSLNEYNDATNAQSMSPPTKSHALSMISNDVNVDKSKCYDNITCVPTCNNSSPTGGDISMQSSCNDCNDDDISQEELKNGATTNNQVLYPTNPTIQSSSSSSSSSSPSSLTCTTAALVTSPRSDNGTRSKSPPPHNQTNGANASSSHHDETCAAAAEASPDVSSVDCNIHVITNGIPSTVNHESSLGDRVISYSNGCENVNESTAVAALNTPLHPSTCVHNTASSHEEVKVVNGTKSLNGNIQNNRVVSQSLEKSSGECMRALLNEKNRLHIKEGKLKPKEVNCKMDYATKAAQQSEPYPPPPPPQALSPNAAIVMNTLSADLNDVNIALVLPNMEHSQTFQADESGWNDTPPQNDLNGHTNGKDFPESWSGFPHHTDPTSVNDDDNFIKFSFNADEPPPDSKKDLLINHWGKANGSKDKMHTVDKNHKDHNGVKKTQTMDKNLKDQNGMENANKVNGKKDESGKSGDSPRIPVVREADEACPPVHQNNINIKSKQDAAKKKTPFAIDVWNSKEKRRGPSNGKTQDGRPLHPFYFRSVDPSRVFHSSSSISLDEDRNLETFAGPSPCLILQALTMSNANDFFSLERLETIGDSFLKYAITVYLYCSYPGIHEGKLSYLRSKQVSNYNLYRLGRRKGLAEYMVSTKFEPYENWLPPGFVINDSRRRGPVPKVIIVPPLVKDNSSSPTSTIDETVEIVRKDEVVQFSKELEWLQHSQEVDQKKDMEDPGVSAVPFCLPCHHAIPDKSIADCVEALIGCYLTTCGRKAALMFMSWLGLKVLPKKITDKGEEEETTNRDPKMSKSTFQQMSEQEFDELQCPPSPMFSSTPEARALLNQLLEGFDSLEEKLCYKFNDRSYLLQAFTHASYHYNTITDCYQRIEFLGDAILDYVITRHLYEDSQRYSPGILTDLRSALVNNNIFAALAVKWGFHCYFKAISPSLFSVIDKFVTKQKEKNNDDIDVDEEYRELSLEEADVDDSNEDDEEEEEGEEEVEMEIPKALGDIFESVAGAIYLDSGMSLDTVWRVYYRMMKPYIDKYLKSIPKSPVRELLEREPETAKFERPQRTMNGKVRVTVNVVGKGVFSGVGRNYRIAKSAAAKKALRSLRSTAST